MRLVNFNEKYLKTKIAQMKPREIKYISSLQDNFLSIYQDFKDKKPLSVSDYKRILSFQKYIENYGSYDEGKEILLEAYNALTPEAKTKYDLYQKEFDSTKGKYLIEFHIKAIEENYAFDLNEKKLEKLEEKYFEKINLQKEKIESFLNDTSNLLNDYHNKNELTVNQLEKLSYNLERFKKFGKDESLFLQTIEKEVLKDHKLNISYKEIIGDYLKEEKFYENLNNQVMKKNPKAIIKYK